MRFFSLLHFNSAMDLHVWYMYISFFITLVIIISRTARADEYQGTRDARFENCKDDKFTEWKERPDLLCPHLINKPNHASCEYMLTTPYHRDIHCACYAEPFWQHNGTKISQLFMEYQHVNGTGVLIQSEHDYNVSEFSFIETIGRLRELPANLCHFRGILMMNISHNKVSWLPSLSCLLMLDYFNASYNRLMFISNNTFSGLKHLRVVDISHNSITVIEPNTFTRDGLRILKMKAANNQLKEIDATSLVLAHKYCYINYENNQIRDIANRLNYTLNIEEGIVTIRTTGIWYFANNSLSRVPDPYTLGLPTMTYYGFMRNIWFRFNENQIHCDCNMYQFLKELMPLLKARIAFKSDWQLLRCVSPTHLSYIEINHSFKEEYLYSLICNYTSCPSRCSCYYQPHLNRTVIDCSKAGLADRLDIVFNNSKWNIYNKNDIRRFLETNVHLFLPNNAFRRIPNNNVLTRTSVLDLSANDLRYIQGHILRKMPREAVININYNTELKTIPIDIRRFKAENVNMSGLVLSCTCDDKNEMYKWLPDWLLTNTNSALRSNHMCLVDGRLVDAIFVTSDYLGCRNLNIISMIIAFACVYIIIIVFLSILHIFRNEIFVLYRRFLQKDHVCHKYDFDLYIAFDDSDYRLFEWMVKTFCARLESCRYNIFFPPRDMSPGDAKENIIRESIGRSRCAIFFLTKTFAEGSDQWMSVEWSTAWQYYKEDRKRKVVCVNYDQLRRRDIKNDVVKAFVSCGACIDFCRNHRSNFIASCFAMIGSPMARSKAMGNVKPKFAGLRKSSNVVKVENGIELMGLC